MNMVEFPGLGGLKFNVNPMAFQIGPIMIYWYGIIIAIGFLAAVLLAMKSSKKFGFTSDNIIDLVLVSAPISIIFARLYYVLFSWEKYNWDLMKIINIREGGIAIYGAIIGAVLGAFIYTKWKKIRLFEILDFTIPYFVLAQAIGRWGNFVNQEAFGSNTKMPWGMKSEATMNYLSSNSTELADKGINVDPLMPVHPTFFYESIWNIIAFGVLIWFQKKKKISGEVFFLYMILYGFGRAIIEGFRTDSLMFGSFRISQVLAIVFTIAFIALFMILRVRAAEKEANEPVEIGQSVYGGLISKLNEEAMVEAELKAAEKNASLLKSQASQVTSGEFDKMNIDNKSDEIEIDGDISEADEVNEKAEVDENTSDNTVKDENVSEKNDSNDVSAEQSNEEVAAAIENKN
jgi:phosphatidylglycerol:prolipoprotein diacylglycerol transferase